MATKCDHCGHLESVKQLSGYANVKGVYYPKEQHRCGGKAGTISTIPQTSDDMPYCRSPWLQSRLCWAWVWTAYWKKQH